MVRQGGLACCSTWGCKESNMTGQQNNNGKEWKLNKCQAQGPSWDFTSPGKRHSVLPRNQSHMTATHAAACSWVRQHSGQVTLLTRITRKRWGKNFKIPRGNWLKSWLLYPGQFMVREKQTFLRHSGLKKCYQLWVLSERTPQNKLQQEREKIQLVEVRRDIWLDSAQHLGKANAIMGTAEKGMQDLTKSKLLLSAEGRLLN